MTLQSVAFNLNVDTKQADQQLDALLVACIVSGATSKDEAVIVFAGGDSAKAAEEAGADPLAPMTIQRSVWLVRLDVAIATPNMMPKVGRWSGHVVLGLNAKPEDWYSYDGRCQGTTPRLVK